MESDLIHLRKSSGFPEPFGTKRFNKGVNFAIFSKNAKKVILSLFLDGSNTPSIEIPLDPHENKTGDVWHIFINNLKKNVKYAYRIEGEINADGKNSFDSSCFLLDPYAKAVVKNTYNETTLFLGSVDVDDSFDWENVKSPNIPMKDLIIYEMHVRGFTIHPSSQVVNKGTFYGVIEKIPYLLELGINAVELMPVQEFNENEYIATNPLTDKPLCNYWGYSTLNFFSLNTLYAKENNSAIIEFKTMVRELHRARIEVILDVVFNHTAEGNHLGPTISFKGIDNATYYILDSENNYANYSGCGNTFNGNHPVVINLILEVLRYFVLEMHVDGFRFDLASILTRDKTGQPIKNAPLIDFISQDPVLSKIKLIAEPWDAASLYQVGAFYPHEIRWSEWNDRYRDTIRAFLGGIKKNQGRFATRISGSEDLYHKRAPFTSVNFITSHDGFTLADLVSYNQKHNMANAEDNRDGSNHNLSWNMGTEGRTPNPEIINLRERQMKNFHLALMISQGVPMILMGDEYGHTKNGNNNTWCQDNELNWFLWDELDKNADFYRFYKSLIAYRKNQPVFTRGSFLTEKDVTWHGVNPYLPKFEQDESFLGFTLIDHDSNKEIYVAFNARNESVSVELPRPLKGSSWQTVVNTANKPPDDFIDETKRVSVKDSHIIMPAYSSILLENHLKE